MSSYVCSNCGRESGMYGHYAHGKFQCKSQYVKQHQFAMEQIDVDNKIKDLEDAKKILQEQIDNLKGIKC